MRELRSQAGETIRIDRISGPGQLPWFTEYIYFALMIYANMAQVWGIAVSGVGGGGMVLLTIYCICQLRKEARSVYAPLLLPVGCAVTSLLVRVLVHDDSVLSNRHFIDWIILLILMQSFLLRKGFLHRFVIATFGISFLLVPYLVLYGGEESIRMGLEASVGYANPNDLAGLFGFFCVYFGIVAIESRRTFIRVASALVAGGSLLVVGLTVSRTGLGAIVIALIVAARGLLKRGFLPVLLVAIVGYGFIFSGILDQAVVHYEKRGMEETGRLLTWPLAIGRFLDSPLFGVDDVSTYVPEIDKGITPHNGFLYVGLASGIIPLAFFVGYWVKAVKGGYNLTKKGMQDGPFQFPLLIYTFIISFFVAAGFMYPWAVVILCNAAPRIPSRIVAFGLLKRGSAEHTGERTKPSYADYRVAASSAPRSSFGQDTRKSNPFEN